jgi:hypothetical protein
MNTGCLVDAQLKKVNCERVLVGVKREAINGESMKARRKQNGDDWNPNILSKRWRLLFPGPECCSSSPGTGLRCL